MHEAILMIRSIIEQLVEKRDQRRDGFVRVIKNAMGAKLGDDADDVLGVAVGAGRGQRVDVAASREQVEQRRLPVAAKEKADGVEVSQIGRAHV